MKKGLLLLTCFVMLGWTQTSYGFELKLSTERTQMKRVVFKSSVHLNEKLQSIVNFARWVKDQLETGVILPTPNKHYEYSWVNWVLRPIERALQKVYNLDSTKRLNYIPLYKVLLDLRNILSPEQVSPFILEIIADYERSLNPLIGLRSGLINLDGQPAWYVELAKELTELKKLYDDMISLNIKKEAIKNLVNQRISLLLEKMKNKTFETEMQLKMIKEEIEKLTRLL